MHLDVISHWQALYTSIAAWTRSPTHQGDRCPSYWKACTSPPLFISGLSFSKRWSLFESDSSHNAQLPDEIRVVITSQLQTLSGVAKGLTRTQDSLLILDEPSEDRAEAPTVGTWWLQDGKCSWRLFFVSGCRRITMLILAQDDFVQSKYIRWV